MPFKAKATRRGDGEYDLSYGKGSKKLTGTLSQKAGKWYYAVTGLEHADGPFKQKRDAMSAWGNWASRAYGGDTDNTVTIRESDTDADALDPSPTVDNPIPQLMRLLTIGDDAQIQKLIDDAPSRDDQLRRWFGAYLLRGTEFRLPQTVKDNSYGKTICPPPAFTPKVAEVGREAENEAPSENADEAVNGEEI